MSLCTSSSITEWSAGPDSSESIGRDDVGKVPECGNDVSCDEEDVIRAGYSVEYGVSFDGSARIIWTSPSAACECEADELEEGPASSTWSLSEISGRHLRGTPVNIPTGLDRMTGIVCESLLLVGQNLPARR